MLDYTGKQYFEVGFLNTNTADIDNTKFVSITATINILELSALAETIAVFAQEVTS